METINRVNPHNEKMNVQVMNLLSGVSNHGDLHLAEVERDLGQMDVLLDDAIKKLCASFMAIHSAINKQQIALDSLKNSEIAPTDIAARLEKIQSEIFSHVGAAMTGLQFQDMSSQLIGRMERHVSGLRNVFGELDSNDAGNASETNEELIEKLNLISERVGARCSAQAGSSRKSVNQLDMDSGDIELF